KAVLYNLVESIRYISVMLTPFMPETAEKIAQQINCDLLTWESIGEFGKIENGKTVGDATPLFARIDEAKKLEELING
ncbi:MAG: methionine--tRNA ligase, partial [Clostridia bacterium]|nr:methionine--tRNA ligase [Clostridia bacterium]